MGRLAHVLTLVALVLMPMTAATAESRLRPAADAGWSEAVVSVSDLDRMIAFLTEVAGWRVRERGPLSRAQLDHWKLGPEAGGEQVLMGNPGDDWGLVRLVRFTGVPQRHIRATALPWDTGGIFSLMVRTFDLDSALSRTLALGYGAWSEPYRFDFPPVIVRNIVLRGPDGVNLAVYERVNPPLVGWDTITKLSAPFNSMQMVKDRDAARAFYEAALGFEVFGNGDYIDPEPRATNFAVPHNLATEVPRRYGILWLQKSERGRVEVMAFPGIVGSDFSERAVPPNIGILMLRFPVTDLEARLKAVRAAGIPLWSEPRDLEIPPYGKVRAFAVRSPDGNLAEIFEPR